MKLLLSLLITLLLPLHLAASVVTPFEINRIIDEFQYELAVNWDQKDQIALYSLNERYLKLFDEFRTQGLTSEDLYTIVESRLTSQQRIVLSTSLREYRLGIINSKQFNDQMFNAISESRNQGASWNGEAVLGATLGTLVAGLLVYALVNVSINISRCGISPRYCCQYYGWVDTNGDGFCNSGEEVEKWK